MNYRKINDLTGWAVFAIAMLTYLMTVAPTASFWDCGEFIAVSNELEVPHPPGAPLYLLLGRVFAMFAPSPESVAYMINLLSVFSSAFTVLFLFWTITILGKKVISPNEEPSQENTILLMFAGAVGALTCTFLDSFWFNAVEAEVYAMSSFFTAAVVWLMLKWEARANEPHNLKWIVLIAYVMGLSIGAHLLNLLTIPALAVLFYYKKNNNPTWTGVGVAAAFGAVILLVIQYGVIQTTWDIVWQFEKILTGTIKENGNPTGFGMPFGTGMMLGFLGLTGLIIYAIFYSQKKGKYYMNTASISALMILIGYSSYALIFIRSNANPPIDENNPEDVKSIISYLKREQYGDRPLGYGAMYNGQPYEDPGAKGEPIFLRVPGKDRYVFESYRKKPKYPAGTERFFPRMHSGSHYDVKPYGYKEFVTNKGADPNSPYDDKPSGGDNLKFFFTYQINHMYWRYFLWNFVGRESDIQDSDWESGLMPGKYSNAPEHVQNDSTRNHYYFLPLLLGLLGLFWHVKRGQKDALIVGMLFFFTGLAIILYLNQTPTQPRERDYSYAGSFQTFCIWIGLGVLALYDYLKTALGKNTGMIVGVSSLVLVPGVMAAANWRDHSRAGNYVAPDSARNLLESCAPNAILFTNGDNDTFPLWYLQEVEGVRTDIRIVNLSLLNTDWYIHQLKTQTSNKSLPLPISLPYDQYMGERNSYSAFASQEVILPVNKDDLVKNKVVAAADIDKVEAPMRWKIDSRGNGQYLLKQDLLIKDMLETNAKQGWARPIYFAITIPQSSFVNLTEFFQLEGLAYRIVPIRSKGSQYSFGRVNREIMYDNIMNKFKFRGLDDPSIFNDANINRMVGNFRSNFYRLAMSYGEEIESLEAENAALKKVGKSDEKIAENETKIAELKKQAKLVLDTSQKKITDEACRIEAHNLAICARAYRIIGDTTTAEKLAMLGKDRALAEMKWDKVRTGKISGESYEAYALQLIIRLFAEYGDFAKAKTVAKEIQDVTGEADYMNYVLQLEQQNQMMRPTLRDTNAKSEAKEIK